LIPFFFFTVQNALPEFTAHSPPAVHPPLPYEHSAAAVKALKYALGLFPPELGGYPSDLISYFVAITFFFFLLHLFCSRLGSRGFALNR